MATSDPQTAPNMANNALASLVDPTSKDPASTPSLMHQTSIMDVVNMLGTIDIETARADDRLSWMRERITTSLGVPHASFLSQEDDNRLRAEWFLNNEEYRCLFVWVDPNSDGASEPTLIVEIKPPTELVDGKIVVFRKASGVGIISGAVASELSVAECNADPWQQLWNATQQIFLPILQFNAKNIDSKRIISDLQKLIAAIQVSLQSGVVACHSTRVLGYHVRSPTVAFCTHTS